MNRHFSNRGEALAEITAVRALASRKASVKASCVTRADRRANSPFWSLQRAEVPKPLTRKQLRRTPDETILL